MRLTLKGIFATLTVFAAGLAYTQPTSQPRTEPECYASWAPDLKGQACKDEVTRMKAQQKPQTSKPTADAVCWQKGMLFKDAAADRVADIPPQQTYQLLKGAVSPPYITEADLKKIINAVYFDPRFANAGGDALMNQMHDYCLYPNGKYQPLQ